MKGLFGYSKGQMFVLYAIAATALLGAVALGTDVGIMYFNWASMQRAVDAAALAGANYLPDDTTDAATKATNYGTLNGLAAGEIATPTFNAPTNDTITVAASRTVPYYFGKVVGLTSQLIQVSASAQLPGGGVSCVNCASLGPTNQPGISPGGTITPATGGSTTGEYGLVPIGLDKSMIDNCAPVGGVTPSGCDNSIVLQQISQTKSGQITAGNWDFLQLGGAGGNVLRNNIADGYTGEIDAGQYIWTKTGKSVGPANQGFADRIAASPAGSTLANHTPTDPRVVVVPIVDWSLAGQGKSTTIEVLGFAHLYLAADLGGGQFQAYYVDDVTPDSLVSATPPPAGYHGARGNPVLVR